MTTVLDRMRRAWYAIRLASLIILLALGTLAGIAMLVLNSPSVV